MRRVDLAAVIARDRRIVELRSQARLDPADRAELDRLEDNRVIFWLRLPDRIGATRAYLAGLETYARAVRLVHDGDGDPA